MIEEIIKDKTSADHLLYVSLKYTKTGDVILNLLSRWKNLLEISFDFLITQKIEEGKIPGEPNSPKQRIEYMKKYFRTKPEIQEIVSLYIFFKRVPDLPKTRVGEFRKNVALNVKLPNKIVVVNLEKLSEYSDKVDKFINLVKTFN